MQSAVREFHEKFGITQGDTPAIRDAELRANLIVEEAVETAAALLCTTYEDRQFAYWRLRAMAVNAVGRAFDSLKPVNDRDALFLAAIDGLCDSIYVELGAAVTFGINLQPFFDEVHRANMTKDGGAIRENGKLLKPPGWLPPQLAPILAAQRDGE